MPPDIAQGRTPQEVIDVAQWLIAENAFYTNYIHAGMYETQMKIVAELRAVQERNEQLTDANAELRERLTILTEAYGTLFGDKMSLAEFKQQTPAPFGDGDPAWCAQAAAAMCRSA